MKIVVASSFPLDSNLASTINVVKIADGFSTLGNDVYLFCREPENILFTEEIFRKKYNTDKNLKIKCIRKFKKLFYFDDQYLFSFLILKQIILLKFLV